MQSPTDRSVLPEFTEHTPDGIRVQDPYSRLLEGRIVLLGTALDETAAQDVIAQLLHLEYAAPGRAISLYINSPGGSASAMTAVHDTLLFLSCPVETVCVGQAVAEAAAVLAAGEPGHRLILPGSRVVLRQPRLAEPVEGQVDDLALRAREMNREREILEALLARHTGRPAARISRDIERELVLPAAEAVAYGLADHLVTRRAPAGGR
ncbi:ATP-dependent Clp protease proteolytic subunit [Streptomyces zingiberis]|uniref:ATP-dependent Clp protease proteolytic subunit n=1 Tax=Streptomyces zingiberis TaxID=2053010 RepID=UPI0028936326|nr:ATP-dependent Clp protease proteolytic subunit [Streptomyces zingiberis]